MQVFAVEALFLRVSRVRSTSKGEVTWLALEWLSFEVFYFLFIDILADSVEVLLSGWTLQVVEEVLSSAVVVERPVIAGFARLAVPRDTAISLNTVVLSSRAWVSLVEV